MCIWQDFSDKQKSEFNNCLGDPEKAEIELNLDSQLGLCSLLSGYRSVSEFGYQYSFEKKPDNLTNHVAPKPFRELVESLDLRYFKRYYTENPPNKFLQIEVYILHESGYESETVEILDKFVSDIGACPDEYHRELGNLLQYPESVIEAYIQNNREKPFGEDVVTAVQKNGGDVVDLGLYLFGVPYSLPPDQETLDSIYDDVNRVRESIENCSGMDADSLFTYIEQRVQEAEIDHTNL